MTSSPLAIASVHNQSPLLILIPSPPWRRLRVVFIKFLWNEPHSNRGGEKIELQPTQLHTAIHIHPHGNHHQHTDSQTMPSWLSGNSERSEGGVSDLFLFESHQDHTSLCTEVCFCSVCFIPSHLSRDDDVGCMSRRRSGHDSTIF
jgi:hypothetical protein